MLFAGSTLLTPLYRPYREAFGFSELTLTVVYSAYVLGNVFALLFLGRLSDQLGRRVVTVAGGVIALVATLVFLFASSTAWLFAGRIVSGVAIALGSTAATAWLAELTPDKRRASVFATTGNLGGLTFGALLAGLLATYAAWPLRLSYIVYFVLVVVTVRVTARLPETVEHPVRRLRQLSLRPRLGVPRELLGAFVAPAAICFATFAVFGYYAALIPGLLAQALNLNSPDIGGGVVALLCAVGAVIGVLTQRLSSRTAMLTGSALMVPAAALLPTAQALHSLSLLLAGTLLAGGAVILGWIRWLPKPER
jgi:MFS family permease